jgi:polyhydroxyalkanoate synthase
VVKLQPPSWDDLFFELETTTSASSQAAQQAYGRYLQVSSAIVESYDVPVGLTPKEVVWRLNKTKLYRFRPVRPPEERHPVPLLLVYALINKPFIFDLIPGRSFIEYMIEQGFDVYLLDWGTPGPEDKNTSLDDYVTQYLHRAVRKVLRVSGSPDLSMLGYCLGATLAVMYAANYPTTPIRNIILLAAPIDFSSQPKGSMAVWLEEDRLDVDKLVDTLGNIPGELIREWSKLLKPMENFVGIYVTLWKQLEDKSAVWGWQAVNRWVEDVVPVAGEAFRQYVKAFVHENRLVRGEYKIDGQPVNIASIQASLLNIVAQYDHLVDRSQAESVMDLVSSQDKELKVIPSTHVGIMLSRRAKYKLWPEVAGWLGERSG